MTICPHMSGAKCANEYCDYWDSEEQACSLALLAHKQSELLNMVLAKAEEQLLNTKDKKEIMELIKNFNIIRVSKTLQ